MVVVIAAAVPLGCTSTQGAESTSLSVRQASPPGSMTAPRPEGTGPLPAGTNSVSPPSTPATSPTRDAVATAYREAVAAERDASATSDQASQAVADTHLDPILTRIRDRMRGRKVLGQASRPAEPSRASITIEAVDVEPSGAVATVMECTLDDAVVYEVASGRVINDKVVSARRLNTLRLDNGRWKLAERVSQGEWEGATSCAERSPQL